MTAFIGPSGCGKSTFLRTLNRMHEVIPGGRVEGEVLLDGDNLYGPGVDPVHRPPPDRHGVPAPQPVPDDVHLRQRAGRRAAEQRGCHEGRGRRPGRAVPARARTCGTRSRTASTEPGSGLSGGQQQRLCIARAIAVRARRCCSMDEPCSALDPISTLAIEDLINELKEPLHDGDRDPQHAAGRPRLGPDGLLQHRRRGQARQADRVRRHDRRSSPTRPRRPPRTTSPAASDNRQTP